MSARSFVLQHLPSFARSARKVETLSGQQEGGRVRQGEKTDPAN